MAKDITQFGCALAELNIEILCANSSHAKGRVESVNRTLQDRLVVRIAYRSCAHNDRRDFRDRSLVCSYGSELRQVFGSLVGNALEALGQGGSIHLRTREGKDARSGEPGIRVVVADTGQGMNAETLARIAEPFFTTKGANGTGLGLWVSHDLLKKHHAAMRNKSRNRPGRSGTVFSIFLPLKAIDRQRMASPLIRGMSGP